ncbi:MAG: hypothetical protein IKR17_10820 [Bacteroidales bacterium]|nr:hypothetical protein [Bacteroidales bacterium]
MKTIKFLAFIAVAIIMSSCTSRILDFTVVSSKALQIGIDKSTGKQVEGSCMRPFGWGASVKGAVDDAIEQGGAGCDMLVDGVIYYKNILDCAVGYKVKGVAINSKVLRAQLGVEGWEQFCQEHNMKLVDEDGEEVALK